jgi:predicted ester cyclase
MIEGIFLSTEKLPFAMPEKTKVLCIILLFFDRGINCTLAVSAPGGARVRYSELFFYDFACSQG